MRLSHVPDLSGSVEGCAAPEWAIAVESPPVTAVADCQAPTGTSASALRAKLECRIAFDEGLEGFDRRSGLYGKEALDLCPVRIEVSFEDRRSLVRRNFANRVTPAASFLPQRHRGARFGVAYPLRSPARRHEIVATAVSEKINRSRIGAAALPPFHIEEVEVRRGKTERDQPTEGSVKESLDEVRGLDIRCWLRG